MQLVQYKVLHKMPAARVNIMAVLQAREVSVAGLSLLMVDKYCNFLVQEFVKARSNLVGPIADLEEDKARLVAGYFSLLMAFVPALREVQ